jgi:hypothetical protein
MKDNEEIFREMKDLMIVTNSIHAENFSIENFLRNENVEISNAVNIQGNENIENEDDLMIQTSFVESDNLPEENSKIIKDTKVSLGVRSKNDCSVLVTPLVQTSEPSSSKYSEGLSPVAYFESLTPDLGLSDDEWIFKSTEGMSSSDSEPHFTLSPRIIERRKILNEKKMIRLSLNNSSVENNNIKEAPKGHNLSLNGAFVISDNTGDQNNNHKRDKNNCKDDDNNNMSNDKEAFINGFNQLSTSTSNIPGANQSILQQEIYDDNDQVIKDCRFSLLMNPLLCTAISDVQKSTSAPIMCAGNLTKVLQEEISGIALTSFIPINLG